MSHFRLIGAMAAVLVSVPGVASAAFIPGANSISSFFTTDDFTQHVIVAQTTGVVSEVYFAWGSGSGVSTTPLFTDGAVTGVAGYFTSFDNHRHVVYSRSDNSVREHFYNPFTGAGDGPLTDTSALPNGSQGNHTIVAITAYPTSDGYQHAVFATAFGNVYEFLWNWGTGGGYHTALITHFTPGTIVSISGYESTNDGQEHVVVATTFGSLTELKFKGDPLSVGWTLATTALPGSTIASHYTSIGADYLPGWGGYQTNSVALGDADAYDIGYYDWGTSGHQLGGITNPSDATLSVDLNYAPAHLAAAAARNVFRASSTGALTQFSQHLGGAWAGPFALGSW